MATTISLKVKNFTTPWIAVPLGARRAAIQIEPDATNGWRTSVVTARWKVDDEPRDPAKKHAVTAQAFDAAVTFSTSTPGRRKVPVAGASHIQLVTTTADGDASPNAEYTVNFQ